MSEPLHIASFNRFEIEMTEAQARSASHQGRCDEDVAVLCVDHGIAQQLSAIGPDKIRDELREYGAWSEDELADDEENQDRIVWCAACDIREALGKGQL